MKDELYYLFEEQNICSMIKCLESIKCAFKFKVFEIIKIKLRWLVFSW